MSTRVAVTGANSAVGCALLGLDAPAEGAAFVACVRSERARAQLPELAPGCRVAQIAYDDAASLAEAFAGCDAVVHLPGVLVERPGSSYEIANVDTTRAVVEAAAKAGLAKLVLVSAVGADEHSKNRYYRSKGLAERLVRNSGLAFTILRAPLVLGAGTEGSAALLRYARAGRCRLLKGGRQLHQPLFVLDLARAALRASDVARAGGKTFDLVGPEVLRDRELVERTAAALGRTVEIGAIPVALARFAAALRTRLAGPGFSPDAIDVITADTELPVGAAAELGVELSGVDEMIAASIKSQGDA